MCQQNISRRTYKTASRPVGLEGIVVPHDGYNASYWFRFCITVKLVWSVKIKQMKARLIWKYEGIYLSTKHLQTDV